METNMNFEQVVAHLRKVKTEQGDESFHQALKSLFRALLEKRGADQYIQRLLEEFAVTTSLDELKAEVRASVPVASPSPVDVVRNAIEQEMPNCKTQAHFDLVLEAWTALKVYLDSAYGFDRERAEQARAGLNRLLDLAPQVAAAHAKLEENPEATTNRDYLEPARELSEHQKQQTLMTELQGIDSMERLQTWYATVKPALDSIVSQKLRDDLFDAIRMKKRALSN
jgi:hypothetical protein